MSGAPWLAFVAVSDEMGASKEKVLGLNLLPGTTLQEAQALAAHIQRYLSSPSLT
jgi:hypothetical protein